MPVISRELGNAVKGVRPVGGYRLRVVFRDGFIGEVDVWPLFETPHGPMTEPFRDLEFFQKVTVDSELGVVTWPNGYDICPDVLRYWCEAGRVCSKEETNAFFLRLIEDSTSAVALNDKPKS